MNTLYIVAGSWIVITAMAAFLIYVTRKEEKRHK